MSKQKRKWLREQGLANSTERAIRERAGSVGMPIFTPDEPKTTRDAMERLAQLETLVSERRQARAPIEQYTGPLYGVRCWTWETSGILASTGVNAAWETDTLVASCNRNGTCWSTNFDFERPRVHGPCPAKRGSCGVYSYKTWHDWVNDFGSANCVGIVELSGRVIVHQAGYRAAKAKIVAVAMYVTPDYAAQIESAMLQRYPEVPVAYLSETYGGRFISQAAKFLHEAVPAEWADRIWHPAGSECA